jgi:hypothetical protein
MKELQKTFSGKGEVKGFKFTQIKATNNGYLYEVDVDGDLHYETFKRVENSRFDCVSYPTSKAFGIWAWSFTSKEKAQNKLESLGQ